MTDKQIEAIQKLKRIDIKYFLSGMMEQSNYIVEKAEEVNNAIGIVLKLLEKQQKEIKRLYKDNFRLDRENQLKFERAVDTSDYVNKETIKNKITELQERLKYYEELDLPQVDDNGVRTGIIKEEEILTSRARILILKELLGE